MEFNAFFRSFITLFLKIIIGIFIQLSFLKFNHWFQLFNAILSFTVLVVFVGMLFVIQSVINNSIEGLNSEEFKKSYGTLIDGYKDKEFIHKNFVVVKLFRKFLFALTLTMF